MYERLNVIESVRVQTVLSEQELTSALLEGDIILDALLGTESLLSRRLARLPMPWAS
jgi:hypothetical protein